MTIYEAILFGKNILSGAKPPGIINHYQKTVFILCHIMEMTHSELLLSNSILTNSQINNYTKILKGYANGAPLQYLLGKWSFYGLDLYTDPRGLIPRPETEILVEEAINYIAGRKDLIVLDICAGSGCIGLAVAHCTACHVYLSDISREALTLAKKNASLLGLDKKIMYFESDLFNTLPKGDKFDIIIANPPYIESKEIANLSPRIKDYEPIIALDGGEGGLDLYSRLIPEATDYLKPKGILMLEVGPADGVLALMKKTRYTNIHTISDYSGNIRVVIGEADA